jgi:glutamate/tyrosine decarboxylase-like PLP-dependent enzyme
MSHDHPYAERFTVHRTLPEHGESREAVLAELAAMAQQEDAMWESGKCSGTMYCGDHDHYDMMAEAFGHYAHMNALQRDMCPSATRFEGEIIAMALDFFHGGEVPADDNGVGAVGSVTSGGTESITSAILAYREQATANGVTQPNLVKPETAHPAFDKGCHLFGVELRNAPIDPATTKVDMAALRSLVDANTVAVVGSACNYGYGTVDPIAELSDLALERGIGLHVDGCLGGYILPWGEALGYDIEPFDFRVPGVTSISADTHKYGYGFKGTSTLLFRSNELRRRLYFFQTEWTGGKYMSPGIAGSRSNGLLAATWASMVTTGRDGYRKKAKAIFETADAMKAAVREHSELRILGEPTFCFSFTSDAFDIYHVNDHLRSKGWRLNGQQYPNAVHMAVTGPQTQPGVVDAWRTDLAEAVAYAIEHKDGTPHTGSIYGGIPGGPTPEATEFIEDMMSLLLDRMQSLPPEA